MPPPVPPPPQADRANVATKSDATSRRERVTESFPIGEQLNTAEAATDTNVARAGFVDAAIYAGPSRSDTAGGASSDRRQRDRELRNAEIIVLSFRANGEESQPRHRRALRGARDEAVEFSRRCHRAITSREFTRARTRPPARVLAVTPSWERPRLGHVPTYPHAAIPVQWQQR